MRLVIKWNHGDGCTYSCDETEPVEFESQEAFLVGFEEAAKLSFTKGERGVMFAGREWWVDQFYYHKTDHKGRHTNDIEWTFPEILTVDEWFASYCQGT